MRILQRSVRVAKREQRGFCNGLGGAGGFPIFDLHLVAAVLVDADVVQSRQRVARDGLVDVAEKVLVKLRDVRACVRADYADGPPLDADFVIAVSRECVGTFEGYVLA